MKLAGAFQRFLASMADLIIVSFATAIVSLVFYLPDNSFLNAMGITAFVVIEGAYFAYYEVSQYQASPGKRLFGLYVATQSGKRISLGLSVIRYLVWRVSMVMSMSLLVVLPFLIKKRCLHDMLTHTDVFSRD